MSSRSQLQTKSVDQLRQIAQDRGIDTDGLQKAKLIAALVEAGYTPPTTGDGTRPDPTATLDEAFSLPQATARSSQTNSVGNRPINSRAGRRSASRDRYQTRSNPSPARSLDVDLSETAPGSGGKATGTATLERTEERSSRRPRDWSSGSRSSGRRRPDRDRRGTRGEGSSESDTELREGLLDIIPDKFAFIRVNGYLASDRDVYVALGQVRKFRLRKGDYIKGTIRPPRTKEKYPALVRVESVNGLPPEESTNRPRFEKLTPLFPNSRLRLEVPGKPKEILTRIVDLISPIGKGQRGLIVSPPKAGKTTVLKEIAQAISTNNPECHLMVVLVDERPEEVTDMQRSVDGEVIYSTFDRPAEDHTQVADLAIERARRLVEMGKDVVVLLDSITRLARAHNLAAPTSGRVLSGGVDSTALYPPKRFFGAARNIEDGGSLTILATALIETGSKMDEVIFEEFKGTGNMELRLDRKLADRRIYPAVDIEGSGTRKEELLFDKQELMQVWKLRRVLLSLESGAALELLIDRLAKAKDNAAFLVDVARST